jgi:hypothetical protein
MKGAILTANDDVALQADAAILELLLEQAALLEVDGDALLSLAIDCPAVRDLRAALVSVLTDSPRVHAEWRDLIARTKELGTPRELLPAARLLRDGIRAAYQKARRMSVSRREAGELLADLVELDAMLAEAEGVGECAATDTPSV